MGYIESMTDKTLNRLKKIQGQVEGIIRMYDECRDCGEIVVQIAAARAALASAGKEILTGEAVACVREKKPGKMEKLLKQLFEIG